MDTGKPRRPRRVLTLKLFASLMLCLLLLVGLIWLLNNYVMPAYYVEAKENTVDDSFQQIESLLMEDIGGYTTNVIKLSDGTQSQLYTMSSNNNLRITIWIYNIAIYDSRPKNEFGQDRIQVPNVSASPGEYTIESADDMLNSSPIIRLLGCSRVGYNVMITTPVAAIDESVSITNRFLLISGAAALLIGTAAIFLISRSFTRPIRQLSHTAASVARLDFSDRYAGKGNDEFAMLGNSINSMAAALEQTISELKAANLRLEGDVEEKTRQNDAHRAFIANVSHELKTPISLIQTYAEGLQENIADSPESRAYYCEVIEDEAVKMNTLIKRMTMLMQLESGSGELVIERFDLTEVLAGLIEKYRPLFEQKRIALPIVPGGPLFVWADEFLIENVITNYITNALNHVNEGGRIAVGLLHGDGGGEVAPGTQPVADGHVRLTVFNTGSHIPPDDLPRIWGSFYKVDKARTRAYGGTGIGLSVVAAIMNAHRKPYGVANYADGVEFFVELEMRGI